MQPCVHLAWRACCEDEGQSFDTLSIKKIVDTVKPVKQTIIDRINILWFRRNKPEA